MPRQEEDAVTVKVETPAALRASLEEGPVGAHGSEGHGKDSSWGQDHKQFRHVNEPQKLCSLKWKSE